MADKICPIMSKPIATSFNDSCPDVVTSEFYEVNCQKEKCALWVGTYYKDGDKVGAVYHCALAISALKGPDGYIFA